MLFRCLGISMFTFTILSSASIAFQCPQFHVYLNFYDAAKDLFRLIGVKVKWLKIVTIVTGSFKSVA